MVLPSFKSVRPRRRDQKYEHASPDMTSPDTTRQQPASPTEESSEHTLTPSSGTPSVNIKRATRTRRNAIIVTAVLFFIAVIFLILVLIGQVAIKPVLTDTWFFELDLSDIFPTAFGSSDLLFVNSIARSLGLHDFYRVGLWNFCEGYGSEVTFCSSPQKLYWFNPVEILLNELLAGATIALPAEINNILNLIKLASNFMFGFFVTGTVMCAVSIFIVPLTLYSRWWSLPVSIFTFIAALLTTAASIIGTVMFLIFRNTITSQLMLNIRAYIGVQIFAFMWIASACAIIAWIIQLCLTCCCASRRDVKTGRRKGSKHAYADAAASEKKPAVRRRWLKRKNAAAAV